MGSGAHRWPYCPSACAWPPRRAQPPSAPLRGPRSCPWLMVRSSAVGSTTQPASPSSAGASPDARACEASASAVRMKYWLGSAVGSSTTTYSVFTCSASCRCAYARSSAGSRMAEIAPGARFASACAAAAVRTARRAAGSARGARIGGAKVTSQIDPGGGRCERSARACRQTVHGSSCNPMAVTDALAEVPSAGGSPRAAPDEEEACTVHTISSSAERVLSSAVKTRWRRSTQLIGSWLPFRASGDPASGSTAGHEAGCSE
ncbi:hypothetical protein T492DRAFT_943725 [Pavlovales sp. CCMP2436]|nr:hypothetical protein T492DRAFT_943725 [Pavlovales sp. CCMP2436]|mmetsp:Transcript_48830/g.114360  ORF Transcript_48830/g.114360 Transcript_48830/m.114360 type:complete len:261 (-) Transcript_48830:325-1107(-)